MCKKAYLVGSRYETLLSDASWNSLYTTISQCFYDIGYEVFSEKNTTWSKQSFVQDIVEDNPEAVYVYNHCTMQNVRVAKKCLGSKTIFVKPTGPHPGCASMDEEGYACASSITYTKPFYEDINPDGFFDSQVKEFIEKRENKWSDNQSLKGTTLNTDIPKDHILVVGQMPGDSTCQEFSFGSHWLKMNQIINKLLEEGLRNIVIKLHPTFKQYCIRDNVWNTFSPDVVKWKKENIIVLDKFETIHSVLPHTKVAIIENSTSGLECMMHDVPIISYGYPEYHWITYDLRHLNKLYEAVQCDWFNELAQLDSRRWLTWYYTKYLCRDYYTTKRRILEILGHDQKQTR
jgi:hypothetical protein